MSQDIEKDFDAERLMDPLEWSDFFGYAMRIHKAATEPATFFEVRA